MPNSISDDCESPPPTTPVIHERHERFNDLVGRLDVPNRRGKAGMGTIWIRPEHPLVPSSCRLRGRHMVILWSFDPGFLKRVHDRAVQEQPPHWSEKLHDFGK